MTRSEFEGVVRLHWGELGMQRPRPRVLTQDTALGPFGLWLATYFPDMEGYATYLQAIAEIATNGLEPEYPTLEDTSAADVKRAVQHLVEVAEKQHEDHPFNMRCRGHEPNGDRSYMSGKQSGRPIDSFIGSHNLPHDTDWD